MKTDLRESGLSGQLDSPEGPTLFGSERLSGINKPDGHTLLRTRFADKAENAT
jgi:hypothetical protein